MITTMDINFASVPAQIRNTLDRYMPWIRTVRQTTAPASSN